MAPTKNKRISRELITPSQTSDYKKIVKQYDEFLTQSRTPTEVVKNVITFAKEHKYKKWSSRLKPTEKGFYLTNEDGTNAAIVRFGSQSVKKGVHIIGAHVDSPCLTAKVHPIRENPEGVVIDCHPYGGIYPHQWFDTACKVVGHCVKKGKTITFELPGIVADATIHLSAAERMKKIYDESFIAESLDVFVGFDTKKEFLAHMKKKWGIEEKDFARTMLTVVPRAEPYNISPHYYSGFGQDDKVCSFAQMVALERSKPKKTAITLFFDREEIGSTGYNGALSKFLERVLDAVMKTYDMNPTEMDMREIFSQSQMISADVDVAYNSWDVNYSQEESASKFGEGLVMDRNNGGKNQYVGNNVPMHRVDAYMELFGKAKVPFKVSSIPAKANTGGGGTIAMYFAHRGIPVVDMGIAVLNMHGKYCVSYLPDLYQMVRGFTVFFNSEM